MSNKATAQIVDFTNVREGGGTFNKRRVPAGDYLGKVTKVEDSPSKKDDVFQYLFTVTLVNKHTDRKFPYYCKLQENQLWKLRNLAIAAGLNVPKKRMKFDPTKVLNKLIGVTLEDDEYDGKEQSVIAAVFPAAELAEGVEVPDEDEAEEYEAEDEDTEAEDEAEEEEAEEGDEFDDMDRAALKAYIAERQEGFKAKKSQSDDDLREIARGLSEEPEADEEEEEEEEEEPAPAPKKKAKKKAAAVTDDELEELDIDDL